MPKNNESSWEKKIRIEKLPLAINFFAAAILLSALFPQVPIWFLNTVTGNLYKMPALWPTRFIIAGIGIALAVLASSTHNKLDE